MVQDNRYIYKNEDFYSYLDKRAYLKWCVPGHDNKIDLIKMREDYKIYINNVSINQYIVEASHSAVIVLFTFAIIFIMALYIFIIGILIGKCSEKRNSSSCLCFQRRITKISHYALFFSVFIFSSLVVNINFIIYGDTLKGIQKNITLYNISYNDVDISSLSRINTVLVTFYFLFFAFIISFFISYCFITEG